MDQIGRLNALHAATNIAKTSNVGKAESTQLFNTKPANNEGFYPGLNLSVEKRMEAQMNNSSFFQDLNNIFGI